MGRPGKGDPYGLPRAAHVLRVYVCSAIAYAGNSQVTPDREAHVLRVYVCCACVRVCACARGCVK